MRFFRSIHVFVYISSSSLFIVYFSSYKSYEYTAVYPLLLMDVWVVFSFLLLLWVKLLYEYSCTNLVVDICFYFPWVELLSNRVGVCLNFIRNHQTFFQSSYAILYFHHQCMKVLVAPHTCKHSAAVSLFNFNHSGGFITFLKFKISVLSIQIFLNGPSLPAQWHISAICLLNFYALISHLKFCTLYGLFAS